MPKKDLIYIVVPVYNEEKMIRHVVQDIKKAGYTHIVVVDDGSSDNTYQQALAEGVICLKHRLNRGKGAAVKTGIEACKQFDAGIVVTMDGDGQHDAGDIKTLVGPIQNEDYDVCLGTRQYKRHAMPWYKRISNFFADLVSYGSSGLYIMDSQSGFRAYSDHALAIINTRTDRYEFESEIIREIATYRLKYKQVPVLTLYTAYSMQKPHKQSFVNGLITLYKLLWHIFG